MQANGANPYPGYPTHPLPYQGAPKFIPHGIPQGVPQSIPQGIQPTYPGIGASEKSQYNRKVAIGIGYAQMVIGIVCLVLNSILIEIGKFSPSISISAYGIWGGLLFFIAGLLQVLSGKKDSRKCMIIATMVMCIIAACASAFVLSFGIIEAVVATCDFRGCSSYNQRYNMIGRPFGSVIAILAITEGVLAIVGSALCCCSFTCCNEGKTSVPSYYDANQPFPQRNNFAIGQSPFTSFPMAPQMPTPTQFLNSSTPEAPIAGISDGSPPTYNILQPSYDISSPSCDILQPSYGISSPSCDILQPSYGISSPSYDTSPPSYDTSPPSYDSSSPSY